MDIQRFSMGSRPQVEAAALKLLAAAQDCLPPGTASAACISTAMMACRNAGISFAGGVHVRQDIELATSLLVSLTLGITDRLHAQPELAILPRAELREWVFQKMLSTAASALEKMPADVRVTSAYTPAQPRREAS